MATGSEAVRLQSAGFTLSEGAYEWRDELGSSISCRIDEERVEIHVLLDEKHVLAYELTVAPERLGELVNALIEHLPSLAGMNQPPFSKRVAEIATDAVVETTEHYLIRPFIKDGALEWEPLGQKPGTGTVARSEPVLFDSDDTEKSSRVELFLEPETLDDLNQYYKGAADCLADCFILKTWPPAGWSTASEEGRRAVGLGKALEDVRLSSSADCSYYACLLRRVDGSALRADDFFELLGIAEDEEIETIDGELEKLEVGEPGKPVVQVLRDMNDYDMKDLSEYVSEEKLPIYDAAKDFFEKPPRSIRLRADYNRTVLFAVAETRSGALSGVLSVRVDH